VPTSLFIGNDLRDLSTGKINSWYWDFGDKTHSNPKNPSHTYKNTAVIVLP
jgi:PKD domain.